MLCLKWKLFDWSDAWKMEIISGAYGSRVSPILPHPFSFPKVRSSGQFSLRKIVCYFFEKCLVVCVGLDGEPLL